MGDPEDRSPNKPAAEEGQQEQAESEMEVKSDDVTASQLFFGDHLEEVTDGDEAEDDRESPAESEAPAEEDPESASALFFGETLEKIAERQAADTAAADAEPEDGTAE